MLAGWVIISSALLYLLLLFAIASYADSAKKRSDGSGRPLIYALSLAVYCTSWTYFGGVGLAAQRGYEFLAIYIGPILVFTVGMPVLRRIVSLAKAEKLTSIADFIAARYGKNPTVAGIVALIAVIGTIPYIALQLKAVSTSVEIIMIDTPFQRAAGAFFLTDISLIVSLLLAGFAVIFGTRHADATEHQNGLILAVATESLVKLVAITAVGFFATFVLFDGPWHLFEEAQQSEAAMAALSHQTAPARWIVLTLLSAFAIIMLPRQFHVTVVENRSDSELTTARYLFPLYLIAINLFVIPIAIAGVLSLEDGSGDQFVLLLPLVNDVSWLSLASFIGGFSAATAMVIVASVAVAIMISNDLVMPIVLRQNAIRRNSDLTDFTGTLLKIRRTAIFCILLLGYAYYRSANIDAGLASIGLLSFAAIAQFAPALIGGLFWKGANARGAIMGLCGGMFVWSYLLFVPSLGGPDNSAVAAAILGFLIPGTDAFSGQQADPFVNSVVLSLLVNLALFIAGSLSRQARPLERIQAGVFISRRSMIRPTRNDWQTGITVRQLKQTITKYLGAERTERSFHTYETTRGRWLEPTAPADMDLVRYSEQLLGSAIGSASARLVLSLLFQKDDDTSSDTARLLDEASEALQYNRDLLQSALGQMDQGITVFDNNNRLSVWNRRFRSLLELPEAVGQVGVALEDIVNMLAERGDISKDRVQGIIESFLTMDTSWTLKLSESGRIIEIRSNPMPDSGVVTTYADITERVASAKALTRANETLEQRVAERTAELVRVNGELAQAQAQAEEANIGKTRFLAAAGHDILQPLNAARLYSSSLVERLGESENRELVKHIDSSLESVESILGAVLDISRLDTGAMKPQITSFPLNDLLRRIETDFAPLAAENNLDLRVMSTSVFVRSDPNLLRRLIQNLVSNAIKYTRTGRVLVGVRRHGGGVSVQVLDTGIGIPQSGFETIFREFTRLDDGARTASGLGLGLSIVDRIARVLEHRVELSSVPGRGTSFRVEVPLETNVKPVQKATAQQAGPATPMSLDGLAVMCIDNEPNIVEGLELLLKGWHCRVMSASSITEIKALLEQHAVPPDAIIADYHLDDGNGIDAISTIRQHSNMDIPAVLATADRTHDVRNRAEERSISVFNKPLRPAALRAFLNQIAAARQSAAE